VRCVETLFYSSDVDGNTVTLEIFLMLACSPFKLWR
jgi:hypothetical protein